jgi:diguanylate cyclase (GGDEF)-like protein/PAS domain S-box-containing protein
MLEQATALAERQKAQVLLVDDEPQVLVALEDVLSDDFTVFATDEPERALRLVEQEPEIAVVVTDQRMPRMSGNELLNRLRKCSSASRVLSTGYADLTSVVRAVNEGQIFAYLTKPWNHDDVRQKVQHAAEHFRLSKTLAEERQLLHDLMTSMPDAIFFKDKDQRFVRVNDGVLRLTGARDAEELLGKRLSDILPDCAFAQEMEHAEAVVLRGDDRRRELEHRHPRHDSGKWLATSTAAIRAPSGALVGVVGMSRDISERIHTQEALHASERRLQLAFAASGATLFDWDVQSGEVTFWGPPGGLRPTEGPSRFNLDSLLRLVHADDAGKLQQAISAHLKQRAPFKALELRARKDAGEYRWFEINAQATWNDDNEALRLVGSSVDVTTRKEHATQQARLEFLASYDELTGLPNRKLWTARLERRLAANGDESPEPTALVLIDLIRLRQVNETLGRTVGDDLLREVATRLGSALRSDDMLARLEGSGFAVILENVRDESDVAQWLEQQVYPRLADAVMVQRTELRITAVTGVAMSPGDGSTVAQLAANAEAALAKAKHSGRPYLFYAPHMNRRVAEKLTLELKLRRALAKQELELFYQPKVQLKTGLVVGYEALIRWRDPERGLVPPGEFIPLLEETGMILDVGNWVLRDAARQYEEWTRAGLEPPRIAVNVSALQLAQPSFVDSLDAMLREAPVAASGLDLEITESVFVDDLAGNIEKLRAARGRGFRIAIDDFGTGYSSLSYLSRMPLDALKIDRAFVSAMAEDPQQMSIVTMVISLAHALELKVIAEGVETATQAQLLRLLRCDEIQGYLIAKPMPASDAQAARSRGFGVPAPMPAAPAAAPPVYRPHT